MPPDPPSRIGLPLILFATALVVLVSGFFAVSDAPISVPQAPAAGAVAG